MSQMQESIHSATIKSFDSNEYDETCPIHGGEVKKEYTYGYFRDASIFTHQGCKCCVLLSTDMAGYTNEVAYLGSYDELHGMARLHRETNKVKARW